MFHACVQRFDGMDEKILGLGTKQGLNTLHRVAGVLFFLSLGSWCTGYTSLRLKCLTACSHGGDSSYSTVCIGGGD